MDEVLRKFTIEYDLKNFETALKIVAQSGEKYFDKALEMVKKNRLFKQALKEYEAWPDLQEQVKRAFGDYLLQRGYVQEAGFLFMTSEDPADLEKSLAAFKKCGNIDMCLSIAYSLGCEQDQIELLIKDLVAVMKAAAKYKEAGDLMCKLSQYDASEAVEYYSKGNAFMQAIRESMKEEDEELKAKHLSTVKTSVSLAYDVKRNYILKTIEDFDKRYLRLKIVQNQKRNMPTSAPGGGD